MNIISANIVAFGKLKNMTINFASGVNLFQQDNGFGKSTLCAFIRAMLYGLGYNYKTIDGVRVNDVVRYKPWDCTGTFGGRRYGADHYSWIAPYLEKTACPRPPGRKRFKSSESAPATSAAEIVS